VSWFGWLLVILYTLGTVLTILEIGKPRKPTTEGHAALVLLINGLFVIGIIYVGTGK
jgi:hypothetical protein